MVIGARCREGGAHSGDAPADTHLVETEVLVLHVAAGSVDLINGALNCLPPNASLRERVRTTRHSDSAAYSIGDVRTNTRRCSPMPSTQTGPDL